MEQNREIQNLLGAWKIVESETESNVSTIYNVPIPFEDKVKFSFFFYSRQFCLAVWVFFWNFEYFWKFWENYHLFLRTFLTFENDFYVFFSNLELFLELPDFFLEISFLIAYDGANRMTQSRRQVENSNRFSEFF